MVCGECKFVFSDYYKNITSLSAKERYQNKVRVIGFDPFVNYKCIDCNWLTLEDSWGDYSLLQCHLSEYLVQRESIYTHQQFQAYKSLTAYEHAICGWVKNVKLLYTENNDMIVTAQVMHSMRLREDDLQPWVLLKSEVNDFGQLVSFAHCTCIAGLGECCSHVGALLFFLMMYTELQQSKYKSVTDVKSYWMTPTNTKFLSAPISDINFQKLSIGKTEQKTFEMKVKLNKIELKPIRNENDRKELLQEIKNEGLTCSLMRITSPFNQDYIVNIPPEERLQRKCNIDLNFNIESELILSTTDVYMLIATLDRDGRKIYDKYINIGHRKCHYVFENTIGQSNNSLWNILRKLRFTASVSYALFTYRENEANHGGDNCNWDKKFESVFFPKFSGNVATNYGNLAEMECGRKYLEKCPHFKQNLGFFINNIYPWFGCSPDGLVIEGMKNNSLF